MEYLILVLIVIFVGFVFYYGMKIKKTEYPDIDDIVAEYDDELDERIKKLLEKSRRRRIKPEEIKEVKNKMINLTRR